jgi:hypothetical protein
MMAHRPAPTLPPLRVPHRRPYHASSDWVTGTVMGETGATMPPHGRGEPAAQAINLKGWPGDTDLQLQNIANTALAQPLPSRLPYGPGRDSACTALARGHRRDASSLSGYRRLEDSERSEKDAVAAHLSVGIVATSGSGFGNPWEARPDVRVDHGVAVSRLRAPPGHRHHHGVSTTASGRVASHGLPVFARAVSESESDSDSDLSSVAVIEVEDWDAEFKLPVAATGAAAKHALATPLLASPAPSLSRLSRKGSTSSKLEANGVPASASARAESRRLGLPVPSSALGGRDRDSASTGSALRFGHPGPPASVPGPGPRQWQPRPPRRHGINHQGISPRAVTTTSNSHHGAGATVTGTAPSHAESECTTPAESARDSESDSDLSSAGVVELEDWDAEFPATTRTPSPSQVGPLPVPVFASPPTGSHSASESGWHWQLHVHRHDTPSHPEAPSRCDPTSSVTAQAATGSGRGPSVSQAATGALGAGPLSGQDIAIQVTDGTVTPESAAATASGGLSAGPSPLLLNCPGRGAAQLRVRVGALRVAGAAVAMGRPW